MPAPPLRWTDEIDGWVLLGTDAVPGGRMPGQPWTTEDIASAVAACETAARALSPAPESMSLPRLADQLGGDQPFRSWFDEVARGRLHSDLLSPWARRSLPELHGLVGSSTAAIDGTAACHGDLRPDNLVVDRVGTTWICDWNWLSLGAAWTDLVGLLAFVHADGHDADAVLRSSWLCDGVEPDAVDAWLALIAAFMLAHIGEEPSVSVSTWLPMHRAYFGSAALSWLEHRRS